MIGDQTSVVQAWSMRASPRCSKTFGKRRPMLSEGTASDLDPWRIGCPSDAAISQTHKK